MLKVCLLVLPSWPALFSLLLLRCTGLIQPDLLSPSILGGGGTAGFCKDKLGEYLGQLEPRSWWLGERGREGQREKEKLTETEKRDRDGQGAEIEKQTERQRRTVWVSETARESWGQIHCQRGKKQPQEVGLPPLLRGRERSYRRASSGHAPCSGGVSTLRAASHPFPRIPKSSLGPAHLSHP